MPTPNMSDEELDSLFQRGAEAYPDDNYLAGWERMETKLNAATKAQALRQKVRRLFAAEIIVLSLLLWQGYELTRSVTAPEPLPPTALLQAKHASRPVAVRAAAGIPAAKVQSDRGRVATAYASKAVGSANASISPEQRLQTVADRAGTVAVASVPESTPTSTSTPTSSLAASRVASAHGLLSATGVAMPQRHHIPSGSSATYVLEHAQRHAHATAIRKGQVVNPGRFKNTVVSTNDKRNREKQFGAVKPKNTIATTSAPGFLPASLRAHALKGEKVDSLGLHNATLATNALGLPLPDAPAKLATQPTADSAMAKKRPAARPAYRVVIGVLGAPAASAVRTAESARLGGDIGLTVEYRFTNRLRVRTGLISSEKRYEAPSTDYTVPASWQWFNADYEVNGSCRITEIPIDLRYDVLSRPAYMVFASVGLNSLFMRDERYSYDWMQNGQTFTKEAHVVDGSHHVLSVLNFSAGVERKLGARWSGQVEPFLQLPLGGVGAGQVRLSSLGAAFSIKFGLFR
jgi:hypothetical protein